MYYKFCFLISRRVYSFLSWAVSKIKLYPHWPTGIENHSCHLKASKTQSFLNYALSRLFCLFSDSPILVLSKADHFIRVQHSLNWESKHGILNISICTIIAWLMVHLLCDKHHHWWSKQNWPIPNTAIENLVKTPRRNKKYVDLRKEFSTYSRLSKSKFLQPV